MKKLLLVITHILSALLACLITVAVFVTRSDDKVDKYNKLVQLETLILQCFAGEKDQTAMEDAAAHAMIGALGDRWSYYIPAEEYDAFDRNKKNEYVGIGITVEANGDGDGLKVVEVVAGGPAEDAGFQPGDIVVEADGISLYGKTVNEAGNLIRGEENKNVTLKILRDEEEITVEVVRRKINVPVATGVMLDDRIGLVKIANFNANCFEQSKQAIDDLLNLGAEKLIFDVRNNGGGYADEMVKLLDYLLPEGQLFKMVDYSGKEDISMSDPDCLEVPMAVLVNGSSYSAAECFVAALREYEAAVVVGEQTSGKGFYQVVYQLDDGSAVGLSIGKYYTPKNVNLEGVGLTPDFAVEVDEKTASAIAAGTMDPLKDPQVVKAVEALNAQ